MNFVDILTFRTEFHKMGMFFTKNKFEKSGNFAQIIVLKFIIMKKDKVNTYYPQKSMLLLLRNCPDH